MSITTLQNMIDPEVMADMISAKVEKAIVVTPFAVLDDTLVDQPGSTITVPRYEYIGDAVDVAEGGEIESTTLVATDAKYTVKKAGKGVNLTDETVLSAYGNPVGETTNQLGLSIASKIDTDSILALMDANRCHMAGAGISYEGIVDAIDVFNEELNTPKVMFVNPKQVTALRKDSNFISADKYNNEVVMRGEIGMVSNARIVPSRRVEKYNKVYLRSSQGASGALLVKESGASTGEVNIATVKAAGYYPAAVKAGDYVIAAATGNAYVCPVVQVEPDVRTDDDVPAIKIYTKRDVLVETERDTHHKTTFISADKHYVAALTNGAKVVLAVFTA